MITKTNKTESINHSKNSIDLLISDKNFDKKSFIIITYRGETSAIAYLNTKNIKKPIIDYFLINPKYSNHNNNLEIELALLTKIFKRCKELGLIEVYFNISKDNNNINIQEVIEKFK